MIVRSRKEDSRILSKRGASERKLRERAGKRAWEFEKRLEEGRGG